MLKLGWLTSPGRLVILSASAAGVYATTAALHDTAADASRATLAAAILRREERIVEWLLSIPKRKRKEQWFAKRACQGETLEKHENARFA